MVRKKPFAAQQYLFKDNRPLQDDNSIIDVNNERYSLHIPAPPSQYNSTIPHWQRRFIRSGEDIKSASRSQQEFYTLFKSKFVANTFLDIEGNSNYAFVLLFDLLKDYETYKDFKLIEQWLAALARHYPRTRKYVRRFLKGRRPGKGDRTKAELRPGNNSWSLKEWKRRFNSLVVSHAKDPKAFYNAVIALSRSHADRPSVARLFYKASQMLAKQDRVLALQLYVHYLYTGLQATNKRKKLSNKIAGQWLFTTKEQLRDFQNLATELAHEGNLPKALAQAADIFSSRRRKVRLDASCIRELQIQHSYTVELLNEYLQDDFEEEEGYNNANARHVSNSAMSSAQSANACSPFLATLSLQAIHIKTLELFARNNFSLTMDELESFARCNGVFSNLLIERINNTCFELLDDLLIEKVGECFIIPEYYYQKILVI